MKKFLPSVASANPICLDREIERVSFLGHLHLDIEDGNFIPNITFGMKTVRAVADIWQGSMDAHLMVSNPSDYVDDLIDAGVRWLCFQVEAVPYPLAVLERIRSKGCKVGIALNPATQPEGLLHLFELLDYCLVMTSEPDGRGQMFLTHMEEKIKKLRGVLPPNRELWADGGIGVQEARSLFKIGVDRIVVGRAIFSAKDPVAWYKRLDLGADS